jgi:deoxyuridine 5'triphosphate nucleotidohydrolase dUTPase
MRKFEFVSAEEWNKNIEQPFNEASDNGYKLPYRGTKHSAGYDFISPINFVIQPHSMVKIPTGIKATMENDEILSIYPRSSIGFKTGIRLANTVGIVDARKC